MRYSNDLRKKVIDLIESGKKQSDIAAFLNLSKRTVNRWRKEYKLTGKKEYKKDYKAGRPPRINNLIIFKEFVDSNNDKSLFELEYLWKEYGKKHNCLDGDNRKVSYITIYRTITNKLGYAFKKNLGYIEKEMKN
jgi:transposase